jgi:hypothetical protein
MMRAPPLEEEWKHSQEFSEENVREDDEVAEDDN